MSYLPMSTETMLDKYLKVKEHLQKDEDVVNWYASLFGSLNCCNNVCFYSARQLSWFQLE